MEVSRDSIDKVLDLLSRTTKSAIRKSSDAVGITKLHILISSERTKMREIKVLLGELMYDTYNGNEGHNDEIERLCKQLDTLKESIRIKEEEIAQIKNRKRCPMCGTSNEKDAGFCKKCAADISEYESDLYGDFDEEDYYDTESYEDEE